jgi:hypothetical protein
MKEEYKTIYMKITLFHENDVLTCSGWFGGGSSSESADGSSIVEEVGEDIFDPGTSVW